MKDSIRTRLCSALRSGHFTQCRATLYHEMDGTECRHCVLGVLCELATEDGVIEREEWIHRQSVPNKILEWAGVQDTTFHYNLILLNDVHQYGFEDLAQYIEDHQ